MAELKPCPFCGNSTMLKVLGLYEITLVKCNICGCEGPAIKSFYEETARRKAIDAWNKRS